MKSESSGTNIIDRGIEIIDLTPQNIENYGVCGYKDAGKHVELRRKIDWFKEYYPKGLRIKALLSQAGGYQGMLEYVHGKYAHRPVEAEGYMFIHCLGVIVAREYGQDLESFAQQHLFSPMDAELYGWQVDDRGYNWGFGEIYVTGRNMAKFGQMYLDDEVYNGKQIVSVDWVEASLQRYSENIVCGWWTDRYGSFFDCGYGYLWWSSRAGDHYFWYASGHGGNYIILLRDLDLVIVTTADPLHDTWENGENSWKYGGPINRTVRRFIKSLPSD